MARAAFAIGSRDFVNPFPQQQQQQKRATEPVSYVINVIGYRQPASWLYCFTTADWK